MKNAALVLFFATFLYGCTDYKKGKRLLPQDFFDCYQKWELIDLSSDIEIKTLDFSPQTKYHWTRSANLLIGVNLSSPNKDTIGILDKEFTGKINKNVLIKISSGIWSDEDKKRYIVPHGFNSNYKDYILMCSVKKVYYGKIIK